MGFKFKYVTPSELMIDLFNAAYNPVTPSALKTNPEWII